MDSFEASSQFNHILRGLNSNLQSLTKAAQFALKNAENEDYLFPPLLDILDDPSVELNTKSTIFQFIEVLVQIAFQASQQPKSQYNYPYIQSIKRDLPKILLKVLPKTNNSNIFNVFNSLKNISKVFKVDSEEFIRQYHSNLLVEEDMENINSNIPYPEIELEDEAATADPLVATWNLLIRKKKRSQYERARLMKHSEMVAGPVQEDELFYFKNKEDKSTDLLSKKQILLRMEDDRETHKRSKENLWLVNRQKDASAVTEDEFLIHYWNKYTLMNSEEDKAFLDTLDDLNKLVAGSYKDKQI